MPIITDIACLAEVTERQTKTIVKNGGTQTYTFTFNNAIIISVPTLSFTPTTNITETARSYTPNTVSITLRNDHTTQDREVTVTCFVYLLKGI